VGTVAVNEVPERTVNEALVPPKVTRVVPVKLVPVIVTFVPTGPLVGLNDEIVGDGAATVTVKMPALVAVPPGAVTVIVPVPALAGTVAVSDVSETTVNCALVPPNVTLVVPVKPVPVIVTFVPTGPFVGLNEVIVGGGSVTVKEVALVAVPPGAVTAIVPVPAPEGTVAVSEVSETTVNCALVPSNVTLVVPVNPVPVIVTFVPTGPLVGLKDAIIGADCVMEPGVTAKSHVRHDVDDVVPPARAYWLPSHTRPTLPPPAAGSGLAAE
jgi:hypothetical protein